MLATQSLSGTKAGIVCPVLQGSENGELVAIEKQPAKKHKAASPSDI